jgi:hypothetical protein
MSSHSTVSAGGMITGSIPGRSNRFFSAPKCPHQFQHPTSLLFSWYQRFFLGSQQCEWAELHHSIRHQLYLLIFRSHRTQSVQWLHYWGINPTPGIKTGPEVQPASYTMATRVPFPHGLSYWCVKLATQLDQVSRLGMCGAVTRLHICLHDIYRDSFTLHLFSLVALWTCG